VFEKEPLPLESPLRTMPQVTLTPHTIGHSLEAQAAFPTVTIENAVRMACGELPLHHRNVDVAAAWLAKWSSRKLL
jgi:phosphoglycerate dehydrogenase-like enzyme